MDVSGSVSTGRWQLQRQGLYTALAAPEVLSVIAGTREHAIAVTVVEWADFAEQVAPWTIIRTAADAAGLVAETASRGRTNENNTARDNTATALANTISRAVKLLHQYPCRAARQVIDVSGDGKTPAPP